MTADALRNLNSEEAFVRKKAKKEISRLAGYDRRSGARIPEALDEDRIEAKPAPKPGKDYPERSQASAVNCSSSEK